MKNIVYLILPAFLICLASCSDRSNVEDDSNEYKFQKELSITDGKGNSADLIIYANTQEALDDQDEEVIYLTTSDEDVSIFVDQTEIAEATNEVDYNEEDEVFVFVKSHQLNPEVTMFSVRSKIEVFNDGSISTRATSTNYHYAYGADDVTGAYVKYLSQTCSAEYLTTKLSKKNSSWSLFWNKLDSGTLSSPGNAWACNTGTNYYKFKLRVRGKQGCSGTATYTYSWLN